MDSKRSTRSKRKITKLKPVRASFRRKTLDSEIKVECMETEFQSQSYANKCRVCLGEGDIMFYGDESFGDLTDSLILFGGIEVQADDDFPKYLCHDCHEQLQSAIKFRQTAQESEQILKNGYFPPDDQPVLLDLQEQSKDETDFFKETLADENTIYHCSICELDFTSSVEYGQHMFTEYHVGRRDECPFCCRKCISIQKHLAMHVRFETVKCDICGEKYLKPNFIRHLESHGDVLPFKCKECPYEGRHAGDFKIHMRKHTGERPYQCSDCSSKFISKSNLNRHILTHKSDHTFQCDECTKGFYSQQDLDMHIKVNHIGVKDQLCTKCGKVFGYRKALMKHLLQVHKRKKLRSGKMPVFIRLQMENDLLSNNNDEENRVDETRTMTN